MNKIQYTAKLTTGGTIIEEYPYGTHFRTYVSVIGKSDYLKKIGKINLVHENLSYCCSVTTMYVYICVVNQTEIRRGFAFLDDYTKKSGQVAIGQFMYNWKYDDKVAQVQQNLEETKTVMMDTINRVMERGEKIEFLVDRTQSLKQSAFRFERQSNQLKKMMCWKNWKLTLLITFVVLVVIGFISLFIYLGTKN